MSSVGGASGDAGVGSVGGTNFGGTNFGGTNFGGTGAGGSYGCFVAGTRIATPSGARPIEELGVGDVVLAYDELASRVVPRPVTATFVHPDHPVGALPLSDGRVLRVTANHPIYLPDQQRYADAGELTGDERLLTVTASTQTSSSIAGAFQASATEPATVYNITVAGEHNYFAEGVLVHNKSGAAGVGEGGSAGACIPAPVHTAGCYAFGCLDDVVWPTSEYVRLNQVAGGLPEAGPVDSGTADAGPLPDGGPLDAASVNRESGVLDSYITPSTNIGWPVCVGTGLPNPAFLAFDVVNGLGVPPMVALFSDVQGCSGPQIGEVWLNHQPPPPYSETTQCLRVPQTMSRNLTLAGLNPGTHVRNARFVSGCECVRQLAVNTSCGYQGGPAGFCEEATD